MATDLARLVGTLLTSLAHARRMADLETAAIAEYYKDHPLLEGMSLPRIRVPEMVIDLPLVIEADDAGTPSELNDPRVIKEALTDALAASIQSSGAKLSAAFPERFTAELGAELTKVQSATGTSVATREAVVRAADGAFARALAASPAPKTAPAPSELRRITSDLRQKASQVALKKIGRPAALQASVDTNTIKDRASATNVVRLKLTLREEGLEWSTATHADGTSSRTLTPE